MHNNSNQNNKAYLSPSTVTFLGDTELSEISEPLKDLLFSDI